jgi:deoxyribodipyrimidine photo-lyase
MPYDEADKLLTELLAAPDFQYAATRNFVYAPTEQKNVSHLSPFIRHRIVREEDVLTAVTTRYGIDPSRKFVEELFWRAYWKGWMEQHREVWTSYCSDLARIRNDLSVQSGLREKWADACHGYTGIECFDVWANEIVETGYLHNHARMWFASIWVFTLGLPWQLGADFFIRHLKDGDPATNTLSWRWICGLQTQSKTYLATQENIRKFTNNRFSPVDLATKAVPIEGYVPKERQEIRRLEKVDPNKRTAVLLHDEDMDLAPLLSECDSFEICLQMKFQSEHYGFQASDLITQFKDQLRTARNLRFAKNFAEPVDTNTQNDLIEHLEDNNIEQIVTPYAPVGPTAYSLMTLKEQIAPKGIRLVEVRNKYDDLTWPHATHGFFRFRKQIPYFMEQLGIRYN